MTFYLKYRPQTINELDLDSARETLGEILRAKEIPHAFLFTGPKGTGKTSSARIVAKAVNCLNKKDGEPCNQCDNCQAINSGSSLDILEIDAASNRGIDDIRELRDKIRLTPAQLKFKIYIIDEVHMLTNEAFNALLKTLEEPPLHAKFILCTTETEKLPGTIVSRCTRVKFHKASIKELQRAMAKVVKGEKLKIKDDDLLKIIKQTDGSFRDAVKILEQLAATGKEISSKRVSEVMERGMSGNLDEWLMMIYSGKVKEALQWLQAAVSDGVSVSQLILTAVEKLRQILLNRLGVETGEKELEEIMDLDRLILVMEKLMQAGRETKGAIIESLALELAVAELGQTEKIKTEPSITQTVKPGKPEPTQNLNTRSGNLNLNEVINKWPEVLMAMRPHNHSLEALLRATRPAGFEKNSLVLEVFYKFHKERLEVDRYRELIETVASQVLVAPIKVKYYLSQRTQKAVKEEKADDNLSGEVNEDIIKTAEEIFGTEVS